MKRIVLEDGKPPQFDGMWTVGEVLQMADSLARWVQSLSVTAPPKEEWEPSPPHAAKEGDGIRR